MQNQDTDPPCTSLLKTVTTGGGEGGVSGIKRHNKFARFRHILAKDPKAARSIGR